MASSEGNQQDSAAGTGPMRCPRCDSPDTKFCYYNNYSTTQPRHFCKNCKRYWTAGGSLRNVPVGGGLRKNKKAKLQQAAAAAAAAAASSSSDGLIEGISSSSSKSKSKSRTKSNGGGGGGGGGGGVGAADDDPLPTSSSSADEPLHHRNSVKPSISPSLAFGHSHLSRGEALMGGSGGGGAGLGLGLGFPYEDPHGPIHAGVMMGKYNPSLDDTASYYTPHYPSPGGFPLPHTTHNGGGLQAASNNSSAFYSAPPYEPHGGPLVSHPSRSGEAAIYDGISKRPRNNNSSDDGGEMPASVHLEEGMARSNGGGLFLYGGSPGTSSALYTSGHHAGQPNHSNSSNIEEPFAGWHHHHHHHHQHHQGGFLGSAAMPPFPPHDLVSDRQEENNTTTTTTTQEFMTPRGANVVSFDEEDEGLGNVVNVRYPYDWEQVSEVLFGGTPDFFQMP